MPPRTRARAALEQETSKLDGLATFRERTELEAAARGISAISPYAVRSPASAELAKERASALASASQTDSTPLKSGGEADLGIDLLTRAHVEIHLAHETHGRRSKSGDLVDVCFGSLVGIESAADILHEFLNLSILSVEQEVDGKRKHVAKKDRKAACDAAVAQAKAAVSPPKPLPVDSYKWTWSLSVEASEKSAALFLNVVSIAAYAAAIRCGRAGGLSLPTLRFITLPDPYRAVPLHNESAAQDCRPDVVALESSAFCETSNAPNTFLVPHCPFKYIRSHLPRILVVDNSHKSAHNRPAFAAFVQWFETQEKLGYLDMTRFCWPELQLTVEAKMKDVYNAVLQQFVYMRQQRRTQPWMQSILGLMVTTEIMGVIRADTLGIEQCLFDRSSSRGVLDSIRVCLGLVTSNPIQRGQHPAFELHRTKTSGPPHLRPSKTTGTSNPDVFTAAKPKVNPTLNYTHRTARFIRLRGDRLHYSEDGSRSNVTYYVDHVVQDNGSLTGRYPRIFCVWREITSKDAARRFVGPYALKVYYADHASDCYKEDLIAVARDAQVKNVLLPTWEWYYGDALTMRGFSAETVEQYANVKSTTNLVSCHQQPRGNLCTV
ncbi:hypothetical protein C8R45DRAFT_329507 [Mycena sanguinolenta]|nr:hypothetical protein C8R45DRAFT_329507 [Mycena sanguinolenta]